MEEIGVADIDCRLCCLTKSIKEEAAYEYRNANEILPAGWWKNCRNTCRQVISIFLQKTEQHKSWGELSGYRKELEDRNKKIVSDYRQGVPVEELAELYHLSVYAIRKIIYQK